MQQGEQLELTSHVRFRAVGDEGVVVHVERGEVMVVNSLGVRILQGIRDGISRAALLKELGAEFDVPDQVLADDVDGFLGELRDQDLLQTDPGRL